MTKRLPFDNSLTRNCAIVFMGGACYGVVSSVVKIAYADGYSFGDLVFAQGFFALLTFLALAAVDKLRGFERKRLTWKQRVKLAAMGLVNSGTTTFYYLSLMFLPANFVITLLFQFTWIGLVFEVVSTRKRPTAAAIWAAIIIMGGTFLASGLAESGAGAAWSWPGVVFGLLSALCCASFMYLSGRVETQVPVAQRGLWAVFGYLATGIVISGGTFTSGALLGPLSLFGVILGPLAFVLPMILFGIGCKHLSPGLATIMAASELPIAVAAAMVIIHEHVSGLQLLGVAIILAGILVSQVPSFRKRPGHSRKARRRHLARSGK